MFSISRLRLLIIALGTLLAATSGSADERPLPPALQALQAQGINIVQEFDTTDTLRAFAAAAGQQPLAIYVTADGSTIVGTRIGSNGQPIDEEQLQAMVEQPMAQQAWSQLGEADWVLDGDREAPRVVYTFSDPNCPYCNQFWNAARPWIDAGAVQLRHIMVGMLRADSATKAAAILDARDSSAALAENEQRFAQGGITPVRSIPARTRTILDDHRMLMLALGFRGTPAIIALDKDGLLQRISGMPQGGMLETLLGPRPAAAPRR